MGSIRESQRRVWKMAFASASQGGQQRTHRSTVLQCTPFPKFSIFWPGWCYEFTHYIYTPSIRWRPSEHVSNSHHLALIINPLSLLQRITTEHSFAFHDDTYGRVSSYPSCSCGSPIRRITRLRPYLDVFDISRAYGLRRSTLRTIDKGWPSQRFHEATTWSLWMFARAIELQRCPGTFFKTS